MQLTQLESDYIRWVNFKVDMIISACVCGKGSVLERPDTSKLQPFYFDCQVCKDFYMFDENGVLAQKRMKFKVGDVFFYDTEVHVTTFLMTNEFALSFYVYKCKKTGPHRYKVEILEVKK